MIYKTKNGDYLNLDKVLFIETDRDTARKQLIFENNIKYSINHDDFKALEYVIYNAGTDLSFIYKRCIIRGGKNEPNTPNSNL